MKNVLFGTTAMIALAALGGTAVAQAPVITSKPSDRVQLYLGGYFEANYVIGDEARGTKPCPIVVGCALPAAGANGAIFNGIAPPASAASPAYLVPFGGTVNEPGRGRRFQKVNNEREIWFIGQTTFDNGITVGARVRLEASTCADQIDESFIWFSGSFGRVELGSVDGTAYQSGGSTGAPTAIQGHSTRIINMKNFQQGGNPLTSIQTNAALNAGATDAEKINYQSPRIAGFRFGISYTPDLCEENNPVFLAQGGNSQALVGTTTGVGTAANAVTTTGLTTTLPCGGSGAGFQSAVDSLQQSDVIDLAIDFNRKVMGVDLAANMFYSKGHLEGLTGLGTINGTANTDRKEVGFGMQATWMNFTLGGGYRRDNRGLRSNNTDRVDYAVGGRYTMGPWKFTLEYGKVEQGAGIVQGVGGAATQSAVSGFFAAAGTPLTSFPAAVGSRAGTNQLEEFMAGVDYTMAPGVRFYGGIQYFNLDDNFKNPANENNGVLVILGTHVDF